MRIGVDFDNTIVCFDDLFHEAATEKKLLPPNVKVTKGGVRDYLRQAGKEAAWTELQGYVYGVLIKKAPPFEGVKDFFQSQIKKGNDIFIISHKTKKPFLGPPHDLHLAAIEWIEKQGFFEWIGLSRKNVFLELSKEDKCKRIATQKCSVFIDDLPEFLTCPTFPPNVKQILFDPDDHHASETALARCRSWKEISTLVDKK